MSKDDILHRFIETQTRVTACNFRCKYCYVGHTQDQNKGKLPVFQYPPEHVAKALSRERLGGTCLINLCGEGETLLPPEMPAYIKALLAEGHFVMCVSNMSLTSRLDEIITAPPEHLERMFFKCSFHWHELHRLNLLDRFCEYPFTLLLIM
jgi:organic radical activating enzyme